MLPAIKEVSEEVLPMEKKSRKFEEVAAGKDVTSTEAEGCFVMCEIGGEQQPVRSKAPPQKRRGDTCGISGNLGLRLGEARVCGSWSRRH